MSYEGYKASLSPECGENEAYLLFFDKSPIIQIKDSIHRYGSPWNYSWYYLYNHNLKKFITSDLSISAEATDAFRLIFKDKNLSFKSDNNSYIGA